CARHQGVRASPRRNSLRDPPWHRRPRAPSPPGRARGDRQGIPTRPCLHYHRADGMSAHRETLVVGRAVDGGPPVVSFSGELDIATAPIAEEALAGDVDVLDLSELEFMDSSGVKVLLRACSDRSESLVIRAVKPSVRRILDMTGVGDLLVFEETTSDR